MKTVDDLLLEYRKLKRPFETLRYLNYIPYPAVKCGLSNGDIKIIYDNEEPIGYIWVSKFKRKPIAKIEEIVTKTHNTGLGTKLITEVINNNTDRDIILDCAEHNTNAYNFYHNLGFVDYDKKEGKVNVIKMKLSKQE